MTTTAPVGKIDLLLFELNGQMYGADASEVLRIARADGTTVTPSRLEARVQRARALVVRDPGGDEGQVRVDAVHGVTSVALDALRRLPPAAGGVRFAIGVWLDRDRPVLLVDLQEMLKS